MEGKDFMAGTIYNNYESIKEKPIHLEPIMLSGKSFGVKLLSVYEFLKCDLACRNLVEKLTGQGFDRSLLKEVCERACIISLCLYTRNSERVFTDGLSVLMNLTPEELKTAYSQYRSLTIKTAKFNRASLEKIDYIKKKYIKNIT